MKARFQSGQSLIEVILVTVVVASVLTALAASVSMSSKNTNENKKLSVATSLVQETLEMFHRERYTLGWDTFRTSLTDGTYCFNDLPDNSTDFVNSPVGLCDSEEFITDTNYQREATLTILADEVNVVSTVTWMDDDQERQVQSEQTFKEIN